MVDTQLIMERLKRGGLAGAGAFAAGLVRGELKQRTNLGAYGLGGAQVAGGVALSVGADMVGSRSNSISNDALEFSGYGMQAAGFADIGSQIANSTQTGAHRSNDVVEIQADASQTSANGMRRDEEVVLTNA